MNSQPSRLLPTADHQGAYSAFVLWYDGEPYLKAPVASDFRRNRHFDRERLPTMISSRNVHSGRIVRHCAGLVVWLTLVVHTSARPQEPDPRQADIPSKLTAAQRSRNVESFEVVWKTIRDKHFDPKLGGLDWQAIHDVLRPKVEAAMTMKDARALIREAIDRLHQTHFRDHPGGTLRGAGESQ